MDNKQSNFLFKRYQYDSKKGEIEFYYQLQHNGEEFTFTDKLSFSKSFPEVPESSLKAFFENLLLVFGMSYWKLFCPKQIAVMPFTLDKEQAEFWNTVYTKGLGEFFYKNQIDFRGLVHFPFGQRSDLFKEQPGKGPTLFTQNTSLVPIGGGKDGIVAAELLKKMGKHFSTVLIYTNIEKSIAQEEVVKELGQEVIWIRHTIDPQVLELNKRSDTYNGHVPTVAMHAFIEALAAYVYGYTYIVLGNEESASYGNVAYLGEIMNHQWSKSLEFETLFQKYLQKYVNQKIHYFSILRPFSEIKIAQIFSQYSQFFSHFVSCNKGYTFANKGQTKWCTQCPKCAFVFALLAAFLPKKTVVEIFGKSLFEDESLLPMYKSLLGLESFKPFECVGTPEETTLAFYMAYQRGEWSDAVIMNFFVEKVLPTIKDVKQLEKKLFGVAENKIPQEFEDVLSV